MVTNLVQKMSFSYCNLLSAFYNQNSNILDLILYTITKNSFLEMPATSSYGQTDYQEPNQKYGFYGSLFLFISGMLKEKVAPFTISLFFAHILPPWASTILLHMYNPNPVP